MTGALGGGGAERRFVYLMNHFAERGNKVGLIMFKYKGSYLDFLDNEVKIFVLPKIYFVKTIIRIIYTSIIFVTYKPDIIFSNLAGSNKITIFANLFLFNSYKVIIGVVNNPHIYSNTFLLKTIYKLPIAIITNSKGLMHAVIKYWNINSSKVVTVYNGTDIERIKTLTSKKIKDFPKDVFTICAVGNLSRQKGYDILIKAFSLVLKKKEARLLILGDGKLRSVYEQMAFQHGISDNVEFLGFKKNPFNWVKNSDVFVLASYYEGFPNVIIEAMVCGTLVIATKAQFGPEEIIEDNETGFLVPIGDYKLLADKILTVLDKKCPVDEIILKASERIAERFDKTIMCKEYEEIFVKVASK